MTREKTKKIDQGSDVDEVVKAQRETMDGANGSIMEDSTTHGNGGGALPPLGNGASGIEPPDPFDPERLRLSQDFGVSLGVKRALITVPVRKPSRDTWFRVRPGDEYRLETAFIDLRDDHEMYLVERELWPELVEEPSFGQRVLFTAVSRQGDVFLWPVRLPGSDGLRPVPLWRLAMLFRGGGPEMGARQLGEDAIHRPQPKVRAPRIGRDSRSPNIPGALPLLPGRL